MMFSEKNLNMLLSELDLDKISFLEVWMSSCILIPWLHSFTSRSISEKKTSPSNNWYRFHCCILSHLITNNCMNNRFSSFLRRGSAPELRQVGLLSWQDGQSRWPSGCLSRQQFIARGLQLRIFTPKFPSSATRPLHPVLERRVGKFWSRHHRYGCEIPSFYPSVKN